MSQKPKYPDEVPTYYANTSYRSLSMKRLMAFHNKPGKKQRVTLVERPAGMPSDPLKVPREMYPFIPQDDPMWKALRGIPRHTASVMNKALLFWHPSTLVDLDVNVKLADTDIHSAYWYGVGLKMKYGYLPDMGLDKTGPLFATWGTHHEPNVLHCGLLAEPHATYFDQGLTIMTKDRWKAVGAVDFLNGEKIFEDFDIEVGASPDGIMEFTDPASGETERMCCEWKAPAYFMPNRGTKYHWSKAFASKYCAPYPKPKPYYIPQMMLQAAAVGTKRIYHGSWADKKGLRTWIIDFSHQYFSTMMTLVNHIHEKFVNPALEAVRGTDNPPNVLVPTDYFVKRAPAPVAKLHRALISQTRGICATAEIKRDVGAEEVARWMDAPGLLDDPPEKQQQWRRFPDIPTEFPPHMSLYIYADKVPEVVPSEISGKLEWPESFFDVALREKNLALLIDNVRPLAQFMPLLRAFETPAGVGEALAQTPNWRNEIITRKERFISDTMREIYGFYRADDVRFMLRRSAEKSIHELAGCIQTDLMTDPDAARADVRAVSDTGNADAPVQTSWAEAAARILDYFAEMHMYATDSAAHPKGHLRTVGIYAEIARGALAGRPTENYSPLLALTMCAREALRILRH